MLGGNILQLNCIYFCKNSFVFELFINYLSKPEAISFIAKREISYQLRQQSFKLKGFLKEISFFSCNKSAASNLNVGY